MLLVPITTGRLTAGDDLAAMISGNDVHAGDIVVVSSKAIATMEWASIDLRPLSPSTQAHELSTQTGRSPEFCEAMLGELERLHGTVISTVPGAALTEVRPSLVTKTAPPFSTRDDKGNWSILVANAGLDESNVQKGYAIGWPKDPVLSVRRLREELEKNGKWKMENGKQSDNHFSLSTFHSAHIAVILTDSSCTPRRHGVTAIALTVSGLNPLQSQKGEIDLFGKPLTITTEAIADQLATAANFLMGNAAQSTPAVLIRDHGLTLSDWEGWVPGITPDEDLFRALL
ncbi:hypothetical protein EXS70_04615 [Candidatus Peribacteria bacterium]|nr:hypothetical protein [Candidatus Peribacteria bacterium]